MKDFTPAELNLAKLLKAQKACVWTPQLGDWFWYEIPSARQDVIVELRNGGLIRGSLFGVDPNIFTFSYPRELVWLPTLEQCISLIQEKGMELSFDTKEKEVEVFYPSAGKTPDRFVCDGDGETLLEMCYVAILSL